jgi:hypothetical protein
MYRCDRSIVFDLIVLITAVVVIIFASLSLSMFQELRSNPQVTGSQLNKVEGAFVFSIIVIVWAAVVFFWAGWKLLSDILGGQNSVKITTPPPTLVAGTSVRVPNRCDNNGCDMTRPDMIQNYQQPSVMENYTQTGEINPYTHHPQGFYHYSVGR